MNITSKIEHRFTDTSHTFLCARKCEKVKEKYSCVHYYNFYIQYSKLCTAAKDFGISVGDR